MDIGTQIAGYRRDNRVQQQALAEALGVSPQSVRQWESGKTTPTGQRLRDIDELLSGKATIARVSGRWRLLSEDSTVSDNRVTLTTLDAKLDRIELLLRRLLDGR